MSEIDGSITTKCSDGSERTELCSDTVDPETGVTTRSCVVSNIVTPPRFQASYTEFLSVRRESVLDTTYELSGSYYTQFNEDVEQVMFQNKLIGNIPDNTYVLMYNVFDDTNNQDMYEAYYCMSKF